MRVGLAAGGVALILFGAFRLLTQIDVTDLVWLAVWLAAAVMIHDGVVAPFTVGVGVLLVRVPPRARRYAQFFLTAAGLVTVVAAPLILRRGSQPEVKTLLTQDYPAHLALLVGLLAAVSGLAYAVQVRRDRRAPAG